MVGSRQPHSRSAAKQAGRKAAPPQIPGLVFVQPLGSGGYADVYLYEQQSPRMPVAVKVLRSEGLTDALREQFVQEADTMAQLGDHPYIVQVFRSGTSDDGRPYLVMKYYPPPNLAMRARAERFSVEQVLRTGIQLASAVETAHRAHITHRDIKPANVLISAYGAPGLTDFGIAGRGLRDGGVDTDTTDDVGVSVPWAPPEVLYGQSNGDERADVYSLAATLWHLLVGRSPFEVPGGDNSAYALMPRIRSTPPPATGREDVPGGLERLLAQAMAKDPARRPATALELARALQVVEQQQRLARTPIVVLDEQGHTTLVSQASGSPTGATAQDDDRTRVKAPQTVVAQPVSKPVVHPRHSAGAPPHSGLEEETRRRVDAGRLAPADDGWRNRGQAPGSIRAVATTDPVTNGVTAPLERDGAQDPTVRRPPAAVDHPPSTPNDHRVNPLAAPVVLWALGAGVLAVLGLVGFLVLRPSGTPSDAAGQVTPSPTISMPGDDNALPGGVFDPPTLTAESGQGMVTFRWTYAQPAKGDSYRVLVGTTPAVVRSASPKVIQTMSHTERAAPGGQLCAVVTVNRGGQESPASGIECETAR